MSKSIQSDQDNQVAADDSYAWRRRRNVIALENFDFPHLHQRSRFDADRILALSSPRMAGFHPKVTPEQLREALSKGDFAEDTVSSYIRELFEQFNGLAVRQFRHSCGASVYEMARAMIGCNVDHPFVAEWMNCQSPNYKPHEREQRIYRMTPYQGW